MNNEKIITLARETATLFRLGHEAEASVLMRKLIDTLQLRLQEQTLPNQVLTIFPQMLSSQERRDWLGLADTLEYELTLLM
ncbi:hypothetical protein HR45_15470 [Shewanella mangrovi]|uniref:Uncharacterized protein n=1 Tax=Shewanella mangrovi TaxID=1515746 RepID=A0A094JVR4_9GAMM|nr:hypothetical protein [Shewanella mangrovi]KFZ36536.1 hypothetical protein HR45_15470 [Shewanella mangrovi]